MSLPFSSNNANTRLDELFAAEKKADLEKYQLNDLLTNTETMEEKLKIIDASTSLNNLLCSIHNERVKIIDTMTNSLEIGKEATKGFCQFVI